MQCAVLGGPVSEQALLCDNKIARSMHRDGPAAGSGLQTGAGEPLSVLYLARHHSARSLQRTRRQRALRWQTGFTDAYTCRRARTTVSTARTREHAFASSAQFCTAVQSNVWMSMGQGDRTLPHTHTPQHGPLLLWLACVSTLLRLSALCSAWECVSGLQVRVYEGRSSSSGMFQSNPRGNVPSNPRARHTDHEAGYITLKRAPALESLAVSEDGASGSAPNAPRTGRILVSSLTDNGDFQLDAVPCSSNFRINGDGSVVLSAYEVRSALQCSQWQCPKHDR